MKSVIFDLDGTLIRFNIEWLEVKSKIIKRIEEEGLNLGKLSVKDSIQGILDKLEGLKDMKEEIYKIIEKYEVEAALRAELRDGAIEVLEVLKNLNLGLVTNNGERAVNLILNRMDLKKYFKVIVVREDVEKLKPYPFGLKKALDSLKVDPKDSYYVGDSVYDIEASKKLGVKSVAIIGGISSKEDLIRAKPDYLISSLKDLLVIL